MRLDTALISFLFAALALSNVLAEDPKPFVDVTKAVALEALGGDRAAWGDFDGDGFSDVYAGSLWRNEGGKKFTKVEGPFGGAGIWGDYDNDGDLDLYLHASGKLVRNDGEKGFHDASAILAKRPIGVCRGACWGDFDGDGFLDLYIGGYEVWKPSQEWHDVIFKNNGGKSFTQVWQTPRIYRARGITCADWDEDGDLDVYVSNYRLQPNWLWRNDGNFQFTNVAVEAGKVDGDGGLGAWGHTIGSSFGDFDNDGHIDLFVGNFSHPPAYQDRCKIYRNTKTEKGFRFVEQPGEIIRWQESYASPTLGDFDNDGFLDLYHSTVYGGDHSVLYRNVSAKLSESPAADLPAEKSPIGKWTMADVTGATKIARRNSYQATWVDYDNDGDLDLSAGGALFQNPGNGNHWLKLRLRGKGVNAFAIGAQVRVRVGGWTLTRQVEGATGEGNQNDLAVHFGLGAHEKPVAVEVRWPDGTRQELRTEVDRIVDVVKTAAVPAFFAMDTAVGNGDPEKIAAYLESIGYSGFGWRPSRIAEARAACEKHGLELYTVYMGLGLEDESMEKQKQAIRDLAGSGAFLWLTVTSRKQKHSSPDGDEAAVAKLRELAEEAAKAKVKIALYPHTGCWIERVEDAVRVAKKVDRDVVGATFNLCHFLRVDKAERLEVAIADAASHLTVVTINGADSDGKGWGALIQPLDAGTFDNRRVLRALAKAGYRGPIGFQGYGIRGNRREILKRTIEAWKKLNAPQIQESLQE